MSSSPIERRRPRQWWPQTTFARLVLLQAVAVAVLTVVAVAAVWSMGLGPGGRAYAELVVGNVRLAAESPERRLPEHLQRVAVPPVDAVPAALPAQRLIAELARDAFAGGTQVRFSAGPAWVWVRPPGQTQWIGVRLPPVLRETMFIGLLLLLTAAIAVSMASWWFARHLTRPLERLQAASPRLAEGEDSSEIDESAPIEVRSLQSALSAAATRVREAARDRELLLAGISHDLRTPLARLRLALELESELRDDSRRHMVADVEEMDAIVGQFVDFIRDGRDEAETAIELDALLREIAANAARGGSVWRVDAAPCRVRVRPLSLRRAIENLMRNAERYGSPPYELRLRRSAEGIDILVRDHGPGLPEAVREHVGRPFLRGDPARSGPGTGLGLCFVARVARAHGASLVFVDPLGGGCEARLRLAMEEVRDRPS